MESKCPESKWKSKNILNTKDNYLGTFPSSIKMDISRGRLGGSTS